MSPILVMLFAALGPMLAVFDPFGGDEEELPDQDSTAVGDAEPNTGQGTEGDDVFAGEAERANVYEGLSGNDTIIGGAQDDFLVGGFGSDDISGGAGNDTLFSGTHGDDLGDDSNADHLDGGEGDDVLWLGAEDTGTGGSGADTFTMLPDIQGNINVADFNQAEDALVVETYDPNAAITGQTVADGALTVSLSTGLTITLPGVSNPLADSAILFVMANPLHLNS